MIGAQVGTWRQALRQTPGRNDAYWLASMLVQLPSTIQEHPSGVVLLKVDVVLP